MSLPLSPEPQYSLQKRLVLAFGLLLILFLGLAGLVLDRAFKQSVATAVQERLQLQVYALLSVAELDEEGFFLPDLEEARFSQIDSGLYGFILNDQQQEVWRSPSALNITLQADAFAGQSIVPGQTLFDSIKLTTQGNVAYARYGTYWSSQTQTFSFVVMESVEPSDAEIKSFQSGLWFGLAALALLLSIAQYFLLRWIMEPLQHLAEDVASIESGEKDELDARYPSELQTVSNNLNLLIKSERERQSRYRTTLGDLAHSLKTPLAVSFGIVEGIGEGVEEDIENKKDIKEQLERMNQIITYQLKRAIEPNINKVLLRSIAVQPIVTKILTALNKVYFDKNIRLETNFEKNVQFYGDESDLMELCGNLLDNAFKYCETSVLIKLSQSEKQMNIEINDDGKGIAEAQRHWVLERGARADTVKSGQGIGLAVAVDIISSYGGEIKVEESEMGGALIKVSI